MHCSPRAATRSPSIRARAVLLGACALLGLGCVWGPAMAAAAQDTPVGVVADPCAGEKTSADMPYEAWLTYIFARDFGQLCQYRPANAQLKAAGARPEVVYLGDSITEFWGKLDAAYFSNGVVNRGISGQTSSQMLLRFRQDVLDLNPQVVHILAGTNDIAGNGGPLTLQQVEANLATMTELAQAHGIRVVLASVTPAKTFVWRPTLDPLPPIAALNGWIKDYASQHGATYVDYHQALAGPDGGMAPGMSVDGTHPTRKAIRAMEPLASAAIKQALAAPGK